VKKSTSRKIHHVTREKSIKYKR